MLTPAGQLSLRRFSANNPKLTETRDSGETSTGQKVKVRSNQQSLIASQGSGRVLTHRRDQQKRQSLRRERGTWAERCERSSNFRPL